MEGVASNSPGPMGDMVISQTSIEYVYMPAAIAGVRQTFWPRYNLFSKLNTCINFYRFRSATGSVTHQFVVSAGGRVGTTKYFMHAH